jgi:LL-diaminopimelate aminotransferase
VIPAAQRLQNIPPYVFARLAALREESAGRGPSVVDLTVGSPDGRPAPHIVDAMVAAARADEPNAHRYPPLRGMPELRRAIAQWYDRRFMVHLDPSTEVLPVIGSKEGLAHLMLAYLNPGDTVLIPTPCYPAYLGAARLCDAQVGEVPLREEDDFRLRVDRIDSDLARAAKMLVINYPNNPTGAVAELDDYREILAFARDHDLLLVSDIAYSELSLVDDHSPASILELPGARQCAVEFQSLSKSHSMAGWRTGFCVGNAEVVNNLAKLKSNVDFGIFSALQEGMIAALGGDDRQVELTRALYRNRRDLFCNGFSELGWPVRVPRGAMYIWTKVPSRYGVDDWSFVREVFEKTRVLLAPGSGFGVAGTGYVRLSLIIDEAQIETVLQRIRDAGVLG